MTDKIVLTGLEVFAHHGVHPSETESGQLFMVDLEISLDLAPAGHSDDLAHTVDYGSLAEEVHQLVAGERWNLIERVAHRVAELVLARPRVEEVTVTVHKPQAPIPFAFSDVAVTIRRAR